MTVPLHSSVTVTVDRHGFYAIIGIIIIILLLLCIVRQEEEGLEMREISSLSFWSFLNGGCDSPDAAPPRHVQCK